MDWLVIVLRLVHVGSAMAWFGGALVGSFFLAPTAKALGREAQPFMDHLANRRRIGVYFPAVAALTVVSGGAMYWRDSGGLQLSWITTPTGLGFSVGALAGIATFILGGLLVGPSIAAQTAVQNELVQSGGPPTEAQHDRLARADRQMRLANRIDLPLIVTAGAMMAVARYL
jgi:uncharacterized membrane protein